MRSTPSHRSWRSSATDGACLYDGEHGEPAEALEQAIRAWLAVNDGGTKYSLSQAMDIVPDHLLAANGLHRVTEPDYEQVELHDRLLQLDS